MYTVTRLKCATHVSLASRERLFLWKRRQAHAPFSPPLDWMTGIHVDDHAIARDGNQQRRPHSEIMTLDSCQHNPWATMSISILSRIGVTGNAGENDPTLSASYGWLLPDTPETPLLGATL